MALGILTSLSRGSVNISLYSPRFKRIIGHLHDDVFLLLGPEFISFFLSYLGTCQKLAGGEGGRGGGNRGRVTIF